MSHSGRDRLPTLLVWLVLGLLLCAVQATPQLADDVPGAWAPATKGASVLRPPKESSDWGKLADVPPDRSANASLCIDDSEEDNDTCSAAVTIPEGVYDDLKICPNDEDWFEVDLSAGKTLSVTIEFLDADGDLDMALYDGDCVTLRKSSESLDDDEQLVYTPVTGGAYDLVIYGYQGAENAYDMTVETFFRLCSDDRLEENDSCIEAAEVGPGTHGGLLVCFDDDDWYAVDLAEGDTLDVAIGFVHEPFVGDLDMQLYGSDCSTWLASSGSVTNEERIVYTAESSGTHYIRVYGYDGSSNAYDMTVQVTPQGPGNTQTATRTATATQTRTPTRTGTRTATPTHTRTLAQTATQVQTATQTRTPTVTPTLPASGIRYVATTGQDGANLCTAPSMPCRSVQHAVDRAGSGEEIRVAGGTYTGVSARNGVTQTVYIDKEVTVRGGYDASNWMASDPSANPSILDAQGLGRVLYITGTIEPTIEGLLITGGNAGGLGGGNLDWDAGGGVYVAQSGGVIRDCLIRENRTSARPSAGGGVYLYQSSMAVEGNLIAENAVYSRGGGLGLNGGAEDIRQNTIVSNTAGYGGGLSVGGSGEASVVSNTIRGNRATQSGGGIYMAWSSATVRENLVFGNSANYCGGGLDLEVSPALLTGNTILGNEVVGDSCGGGGVRLTRSYNATLVNNVVAGNTSGGTAAGIYVYDSRASLLHNTIAHNSGGDGTAVVVSREYQDDATAELVNCTIIEHGVGISVTQGSTVTLDSTLWHANTKDWAGAGAIMRERDHHGDPAFVDAPGGDYHIGPTSAAIDKGEYADVLVDMDGDTRPQGAAPDLGADEYVGAVPATTPTATQTLAATRTRTPTVTPTMPASGFRYVATSGQDGTNACTVAAMPCASVQHAMDQASPGDEIRVAGGTYTGVSARSGVTQTVYIDKEVTVRGGYHSSNWTVSDPAANPSILDAQGLGRVLYITGTIEPSIEGLHITGGDATGLGGGKRQEDGGGGVYAFGVGGTISDCVVHANRAGEGYSAGGGLYLLESTVTVVDSSISDNEAEHNGGGLCAYSGSEVIQHNTFVSNTADYGGGLYVASWATKVVTNTVRNNHAMQNGGGISLMWSAAVVRGNLISANSAAYHGGGLDLQGSSAHLSGNTIVGNEVGWDDGGGGALRLVGGSNAVLFNNVVADNYCEGSAGGLHISDSHVLMLHNTIAHNSGGDGVAVLVMNRYQEGVAAELVNCMITGHTVGVTVTQGNTATLRSTLWYANSTDWGGAGVILRERDYTGDPAFVNAPAGDYHIGLGSAAIDKGEYADVWTDIDGDTRPQGVARDIGADEYSSGPLGANRAYLPVILRR